MTIQASDPVQVFLNARAGDYIVKSLLKTSGQAAVFQAKNQILETDIALKVYGPFERRGDLNKPLNDARRQARINHPAVLQVETPFTHEYALPSGEEVYFLCIPMRLSTRGSCESWNRFRGAISVEHIEDLKHLFEGVKAIHQAGITHNDLKPGNILQIEDGPKIVMKITDFGIARSGDLSKGLLSQLTPQYAPPEQFDGEFSEAGDIYSLGATVYHLITGLSPFELPVGDSWKRVHLESPRPDATTLNEHCVVRLSLLLMRMMAPDRKDRPSIDDCIAMLDKTAAEIDGHSAGYRPTKVLQEIIDGSSGLLKRSRYGTVFSSRVHKSFGRDLWIIQLRLTANGSAGVSRAIAAGVHFFSDCFSVYETYGLYDLLFRVWSSRDRMEAFMERLKREDAHEVDFHKVGELFFPGVQESATTLTRSAAIGLQEGVKPFSDVFAEHVVRASRSDSRSVRAFTFVEPRLAEDKRLRKALFFRFKNVVEGIGSDASLCYFTDACRFFCMIEFVKNDFDKIWKVPAELVQDDQGARFRTSTLLATNRLIYESDRIRL